MAHPAIGLRRALARVRPPHIRRPRVAGPARPMRPGRLARAAIRPVGRRVGAHLGLEAAAPAAVAAILALASLVSWLPGTPARGAGDGAVAGAVGGPPEPYELTPIELPSTRSVPPSRGDDRRSAVRLDGAPTESPSADGETTAREPATPVKVPPNRELTRIDPDALAAAGAAATSPPATGPLLADGTLVKPIAVDTIVPDGKHLIRIHRTVKGDSLARIAERYNVSMMTIWWANDLRSHTILAGKTLAIPPVDGLVHVVREGDTVEGLAEEHDIDVEPIRKVNGLDDPVLVPGQTLILPGAAGEPIPEPEPEPEPERRAAQPGTRSGGGAGGSGGQGSGGNRAPATYGGGPMVWPVVGGNNFVSRGFASGHYGLDIAGDHGARVVAAAGGTVIFAGWKPNGGGYQVWLAHGSGIYTTYNHLSAVSVGNGQGVGAGQMIGRLGDSGNSTGPHLHFEVWQGEIWAGGDRVNPAARL